MTLTVAQTVREDEHLIVFPNTRSFAAKKWTTTVEAQDLGLVDRGKAQNIDSYDKFGQWILHSINESSSPAQSSRLQTLQLLAKPLGTFTNCFERLIAPEKADMSILWGLVYLNIKLALDASNEQHGTNEKLKRVTQWLSSLRRVIESLNQCVANHHDDNSARTQITDVFEPLLQLLTDMIKFQHTYVKDAAFRNAFSTMKDLVDSNLNEIEEVVSHFRQIHANSKEVEEAAPHVSRSLAFRDRPDPNDFTAFPIDHLPNIHTEKFFGREASIERIHHFLGNQDLDQLRTYIIYGRRGIGKTQIALEYARRYKSKYDAVFWVRCETSASLRQSFADIAVALEIPGADGSGHFQENTIRVLAWLKKTSRTWLLIFDNAEREQLLTAYWPKDARGSILITSRSYYNFENSESRHGETVPLFNEEERWDLLMEFLGQEWQSEHLGRKQGLVERAAAKQLMEKLGGLALAISQAATLILDTRVNQDRSIHSLLQLFEHQRTRLPPRQIGHRDALIHALDTVWSIALDVLSPNARRLLGVFAMLSPDSIPIDLFLPANQSRLNGSLEFCKQADGANATEMSSSMKLVVQELLTAGLIRQDNRVFIIHRVIQEAFNFDEITALQEAFDAATELLAEAFPTQRYGRPMHADWPRCQMYVQHVVHLSNLFVRFRKGKDDSFIAPLDFVRLLSECGWYLFEIADSQECLKMMEIACSASESKSSLLYANLSNTIGAARFELNQLKQSRAAFEITRTIRMEHLQPDDVLVAGVLGNIGNVESAEGNLEDALDLFVEAARIHEQQGEKDALLLGLTFMQMGRVWFLKGDNFQALQMYSKAQACFMKKFGQDQIHSADLEYAMGNLELERRDLNQAQRHYDTCKDLSQKNELFSPLVTATFYKLGCVEWARGHADRALAFLEKAYDVADIRSPGEIDGTIARIMWKKAEILLEDPLRRVEGEVLRKQMIQEHDLIAAKLQLSIDHDSVSTDHAFDLLVPGYFR